MALISYQINRTRVTPGVFTRVWLTYKIGAITTEAETDTSMTTTNVTRYRPTANVGTELLKGATVTAADMNNALAAKAAELGHTPVEGQTN